MKKIFIMLLMAALFFVLKNEAVFAADLEVTPQTTPLFSAASDGYFVPGKSLTKTVVVKNNSSETKLVAITPSNFINNPPQVSTVFEIAISDNFGNTLYGASPKKFLSDFYTINEYPLTYLLSNHSVTYSFNVNLDSGVGNEWQNKQTGFDLAIGFYSETPPETTPTPTPTPQSGGKGGGGGGEGGPTSTPTPDPGTFIPVSYGGEYVYVPVLGVETSITPSPAKKAIFGTQKKKGSTLGACANPWWWWLLYLVQIVFQIIFRKKASPAIRKRILFAEVISGLLCAFIFWKFFCNIIFAIISALISLFFLLLTHRKTRK